jgi:hypothetical protein
LIVTQDFTVLGSSSIQNVSSSVLNIGTNIITVAVNQPAVRFGGISVIDSGSSGQSGSFLYDSVQDEFIFLHKGNGTNVTSSHFIMGPETYDNLGNEIYLTNNRLPKGTGKEHLNDSQISDDGTTVTIPGALTVTGNITGPVRATNGVVSGSSQVIGILSSLNTYTGSNDATNSIQTSRLDQLTTASGSAITRLTALEVETTNLELFSGSQLGKDATLATYTGSVEGRFTTLGTYTGSVDGKFTTLGTYTGSVDGKFTTLATHTGSVNTRLTEIGVVSASLILSASVVSQSVWHLHQFSSSENDKSATLATYTGSVETRLTQIGVVSGSLILSASLVSSSVWHLHQFSASATASLVRITASIVDHEDRIRYVEGLNGITGGNPLTPLNQFSASAKISIANLELATGSYETKGRGIVSGSSQVVSLLPTGVVSGSVQVLGGSTIHSSSIGNYQFNSIGVNIAPTGVAGEIVATADITAFYSSDIRLKENIQPIENALEKVNQISGNTYNWKNGFEEIHSHKGTDVGVIAQEIELILPQIVTNRDNGFKAVQYEKIIPLLIEAIKELSAKVDRMENK